MLGCAGKYVDIKDTVSGFKAILEGKYDDLPEMAFYMVGDISEVSFSLTHKNTLSLKTESAETAF